MTHHNGVNLPLAAAMVVGIGITIEALRRITTTLIGGPATAAVIIAAILVVAVAVMD